MSGKSKPSAEKATSRNRRLLRRFRPWEKKRGSRQTGSKRWGSAGEALFFAVLFLLGVLALTELLVLRLVGNSQGFLASGWGLWLSVLMLSSLIVVGAAGAIYSTILAGASAERRAAMAKRATDIELLAEARPSPKDYPNVPRETNWTNSPGICLAYRLPIASSPAWRLVIVASFCLIWNGAVAVLAVIFLNPTRWSNDRWLFGGMVILYAIIGGSALVYLFRMLLAATSMGPTSIEVSVQPLFPGQTCQCFLTQAGHVRVNWLELRLVCDEEVSFSDGTDTRTESRRVHDELVFRKEAFDIVPSEPFQHECPLDVPADGMHSFLSAHNAVIWKLVVTAAAQKWPTFERVFPLVVYPSCSNPT